MPLKTATQCNHINTKPYSDRWNWVTSAIGADDPLYLDSNHIIKNQDGSSMRKIFKRED